MKDRFKDYVERSINDGKEILRRYQNGIDYIFIKEDDGWYSIFNVTGGICRPVIQAKDLKHADSYIAMMEPVSVPVTFL